MKKDSAFRLFALVCLVTALASLTNSAHAQTGGRPDIVWMRGGHYYGPLVMDFLGNDRLITVGNDTTIKVHRLSDGLMLRSARTGVTPELGGKVSPDGKLLAFFIAGGKQLHLWDTTTLTDKLGINSQYGFGIAPAFSADSSLFTDYRNVYNVSDGSLFWDPGQRFQGMAPSGRTVATSGNAFGGWGRIWNKDQSPDSDAVNYFNVFAFSQTPGAIKTGGAQHGFFPNLNQWRMSVFANDKQWDYGPWPLSKKEHSRFIWPNTTQHGDRYLFGVLAVDLEPGSGLTLIEKFEAFDTEKGLRHTLAGSGFTLGQRYTTVGSSIAASPDGKLAAVSHATVGVSEPVIQVVTVPDGKPAADLNMHTLSVRGVAYSAQPLNFAAKDGKSTVSAHVIASVGLDKALFLWDARNGERLSAVALPSDFYQDTLFVTFSPDARTAAVQFQTPGGAAYHTGGGVWLYDITNPRSPVLTGTLGGGRIVYRPSFSHDGQYLAYGAWNGGSPGGTGVHLFQKQNGVWNSVTYREYTGFDYYGSSTFCAFAPDDKSLIVSCAGLYRLSLPSLNIITRFLDRGGFTDMALSEDGTRIVGRGYGTGVHLLNGATFAPIYQDATYSAGYGIAIDPCTENFAYRYENDDITKFTDLVFRSAADGTLRRTYNDETGFARNLNSSTGNGQGNAAAFSPDGQFLTFVREDPAVVVMKNPYWKPPTAKFLSAPSPTTGGKTVNATVTLECPAEIGGTTITLSSGDPNLAYLPAKITIPVGKRSAEVPVSLAPVVQSKTVTLSATANRVTKTFSLTIAPVNVLTANANLTRVGANLVATIKVNNSGGGEAKKVRLTQATLGGESPLTTLPLSLGDIPAGQSRTVTVTFRGAIGAPGSATILRIGGASDASSFSAATRVTLP